MAYPGVFLKIRFLSPASGLLNQDFQRDAFRVATISPGSWPLEPGTLGSHPGSASSSQLANRPCKGTVRRAGRAHMRRAPRRVVIGRYWLLSGSLVTLLIKDTGTWSSGIMYTGSQSSGGAGIRTQISCLHCTRLSSSPPSKTPNHRR